MNARARTVVVVAVALIVTAGGEAALPPPDREAPSKPTVDVSGVNVRPVFHFGARDDRTPPAQIRRLAGRSGRSWSVSGAAGAFPGRNGSIVFASQRSDGGWELYAVTPRGGTARQLTAHSPVPYGKPALSPDGRTIAFSSAYDDAVFLAKSDGGRAKRIPLFAPGWLGGVRWSPDGKRLVYSAPDGRGGSDVWIADRTGAHLRRLASGATPEWSPDGTTVAFANRSGIHVIRSDGTQLRLLTAGGDPRWSPDGRLIAFTRNYGTVYVVGANGGRGRLLGEGFSPAWSPDSRQLVAGPAYSGTNLILLPVDGGSRRELTSSCIDRGFSEPYDAIVWAPSPRIVAATSCQDKEGLQSIDPVSGGRRWLALNGADPSSSADGGKLAFLSDGFRLEVVRADGSGRHRVLAPAEGGETHPAWSPDGTRLAVETMMGKPNPLPGAPTLVNAPLSLPTWSPDGKQIVGNSGDGFERVQIVDLQTGATRTIYDDTSSHGLPTLTDAAWSPDGRRIAFGGDQGLGFYDVQQGRVGDFPYPQRLVIRGHPSWSPDGKRLAFDAGDCREPRRTCAIFVAAPNGTHAQKIAANAFEPAWSPDGRQIAFVRLASPRNSEIYVMNTDGTGQRRLTFNPGPDVDPDWQPLHRPAPKRRHAAETNWGEEYGAPGQAPTPAAKTPPWRCMAKCAPAPEARRESPARN